MRGDRSDVPCLGQGLGYHWEVVTLNCRCPVVHFVVKKAEGRGCAMTDNLETAGLEALKHLGFKHAARERELPKSRTAIR